MRILPVDRKRFIHLDVLARLDASAAKNALLRVVAVEGVGMILFVRLGMIGNPLMFDCQQLFRGVDSAVSVVVVAHGAVENVIAKNPVKRLPLGGSGFLCLRQYHQPGGHGGRAGSRQAPIDFNHACVARLNGAKLGVVTHLRKLYF